MILEKLTESKNSLLMALYWGGPVDHYTFDMIQGLSSELKHRGHQAVISRILESWPWNPDILIVFRKEDAVKCINKDKPFFFMINDETLLNDCREQNFEEYREIDDNDCKEGSIIGGILGAGLALSSSRGKDRFWAVPAGGTAGALIGCQVDGG